MEEGRRLGNKQFVDIAIYAAYCLLSVYLILYIISFLTVVHLPIYPTINRITFFGATVSWSVTGSLQQDMIIMTAIYSAAVLLIFRRLVSLPLAIGTIAIATSVNVVSGQATDLLAIGFWLTLPILVLLLTIVKTRNHRLLLYDSIRLGGFFTAFLAVGIALQLIVLARWAIYPSIAGLPYQHWSWHIAHLDTNFFYAIGLLSPYLFLLSAVSFLFKPFVGQHLHRIGSFLKRNCSTNSLQLESNFSRIITNFTRFARIEIGHIPLILITIILFSVALSAYPHSIMISSDLRVLGADIPTYLQWMNRLSGSSNLDSLLLTSFRDIDGGGRPLSLLAIYSLAALPGESYEAILKYLPTILSPLIVIAVYLFTRGAYPDSKNIAIIAAVMTAVSHQVIVGFYAAFYSNWMALIAIYVSSLFLLKSTTTLSRRNVSMFAGFSIIALFLHSYTWSYFIIVIVLYLAWTGVQFKKARNSLYPLVILALITLAIVGIDAGKSYAWNTSTGFEKNVSLSTTLISPDEFPLRWLNLNAAFRLHVGGFLTNTIVLGLLLAWAVKADYHNNSDRFLVSSLFVALIPILFGDFTLQARMIYNIPIQIPASIMMYKIYTNSSTSLGKPLFIALLLTQLNYALRSMANMHLIIPN